MSASGGLGRATATLIRLFTAHDASSPISKTAIARRRSLAPKDRTGDRDDQPAVWEAAKTIEHVPRDELRSIAAHRAHDPGPASYLPGKARGGSL